MTSSSFSRRSLLAGAAGVAAAASLAACRPASSGSGGGTTGGASAGNGGGESYNWDMTITIGNTSTWWAGAEKFGELLAEKSEGRIKLNLFANEQLSSGDPAAGIEMLQNNQKAFSYNSTIIYGGLNEKFGTINAPFLYADLDEADANLESAAEAYKALAESMNVKMLGFGESGMRQVTNNIRAIHVPADLAGIKIRVPGISMFQDIFAELGANPTTMNFSEVFTALQQGTIDGQENPVEVTASSGLQEVQKFQTNWNYVYDPLILGMAGDLWGSLSEEDQQIVQESADEANEFQRNNTREVAAEREAEMAEVMEITDLTADELQAFRDAMVPIYEKYIPIWGEETLSAVGYQG